MSEYFFLFSQVFGIFYSAHVHILIFYLMAHINYLLEFAAQNKHIVFFANLTKNRYNFDFQEIIIYPFAP